MTTQPTMKYPPLPTHANVWTGTEMIHPEVPPEPDPLNPAWVWVCCGCCAGLEWSAGYEPIECSSCGGSGRYAVHLPSGRGALWPGGPFNGWRFDTADPLPVTEPGEET